MKRHAFDPVSFFFGLLFATVAVWLGLIGDNRLSIDDRWFWPVILITAGVTIAFSGLRRRDHERGE